MLTINAGAGAFPVIIVSDLLATLLQVVISDLTVDGGMTAFSGIFNRENLTLNNVIITAAQAGIINSGQFSVGAILTISNSNLTGNSESGIFIFGGLEPSAPGGHVTINNSNISDNGVFGIFNLTPQHEFAQGSKVVVNNTTISANKFGIINNAGSGASGNIGSSMEVYNSTITKNFGQAGAANGNALFNTGGTAEDATGGKVIVHNSTISNNDGVGITAGPGQGPGSTASITQISSTTVSGNVFALIYLPGGTGIPVVEVKNSIFANSNKAPDVLFPINCAPDTATLTSLGVNISTDDTCAGFVAVTTDELNLGPLQNNGGPTETQALSTRSAAVDLVSDCTFINGEPVLTDQRGFLRPPTNCDVGAFELGEISPEPRIVPTLSEWGVVMMAMLLGIVGVLYFNRKYI